MVKQRSIGPDNLHDADDDTATAFLDALRTKGTDMVLVRSGEVVNS